MPAPPFERRVNLSALDRIAPQALPILLRSSWPAAPLAARSHPGAIHVHRVQAALDEAEAEAWSSSASPRHSPEASAALCTAARSICQHRTTRGAHAVTRHTPAARPAVVPPTHLQTRRAGHGASLPFGVQAAWRRLAKRSMSGPLDRPRPNMVNPLGCKILQQVYFRLDPI